MKKNVRNLLIMFLVLAVLGGAVAVLLLSSPAGEDATESSDTEDSASDTPQITLIDRELTDVTSVKVENKTGSYTLVPSEGAAFTLEGYEEYDLSVTSMSSAVENLVALKAEKELGQQDSGLEDFGLAGEDAVSVEIAYSDGSTDKVAIGNMAAESTGRYVEKDGEVYISANAPGTLKESKYSFFNTEVYTIADRIETETDDEGNTTTTTGEDIMSWIKFSGAAFPEPIEIERDLDMTSAYLITSPVMAESGTTAFTDIITALKTIAAEKVVAARPTEEELEEFGLAEPDVVVEFELNSEEHKLVVSALDADKGRYLMIDDLDVVYRVAEDTVATWAETQLSKLRMSYTWLVNIMYVEKLTYTLEDGTQYCYDITRTVNEDKSTDEYTSYDLSVKNKDGEDIDYENYQDMYQKSLAVAVLNQDKPEYGGTPALKIEYQRFESNGGETDTVEFFAVGEDRYAATVNGGFNGQVRRSEVDKLISLLPVLDANQPIE